jgi:hypothetical protein
MGMDKLPCVILVIPREGVERDGDGQTAVRHTCDPERGS